LENAKKCHDWVNENINELWYKECIKRKKQNPKLYDSCEADEYQKNQFQSALINQSAKLLKESHIRRYIKKYNELVKMITDRHLQYDKKSEYVDEQIENYI
jgi:hypothetical protein